VGAHTVQAEHGLLLAALDRHPADVSVLGRQPDPRASAASSLLPLMKGRTWCVGNNSI
jgi:hypothetical protein